MPLSTVRRLAVSIARGAGLTLLELAVLCALLGVGAYFAVPAWHQHRISLRRVEARSVVPVVSTIPDHRGTAEFTARSRAFNGIIRRVAAALHIPLLDYHTALASLPNAGLSDDNIHPSAYVENGDTRAGVFTPAGLRNGYNVRNLTLLLMLERLIETVGARS